MTRILCSLLMAAVCSLSAAESVIVITSAKQFDELIAATKETVIVDFHAEWCGPCKMLGPILKEVVGENPGKVVLLTVDIDKNADLAQRYSVESIPLVYRFQGGKLTSQKVGFMEKDAVKAFFGL